MVRVSGYTKRTAYGGRVYVRPHYRRTKMTYYPSLRWAIKKTTRRRWR